MSIASKHQKDYLEIKGRTDGFEIDAHKDHADELVPLFRQWGIPCRREPGPVNDAIVFGRTVDRARVEQILLGYEAAAGS
jgi:hypothetical protein